MGKALDEFLHEVRRQGRYRRRHLARLGNARGVAFEGVIQVYIVFLFYTIFFFLVPKLGLEPS